MDETRKSEDLKVRSVPTLFSPVLANFTLDGLETELRQRFPKPKTGHNAKVNLVRYCDDFIVTAISKEVLETEVKPFVEQFLHQRGLELSPEKTRITHIETGFDFLGQTLRKYNGKLIIKPSRKSVKAFLSKLRGVIKANKQTPAGKLIGMLNPMIRGWADYHRHVVSKVTFSKIGHAIFQALWRWAKRRHPNQPKQWIKEKYFKSIGGNNWVFSGTTVKDGKVQQHWLLQIASVPIERHVKIKGAANPYDPTWETYFEKRLDVKMANDLKGKRTLLYLWQEQAGICPICHEPLTKLTEWHSHHIVWKALGQKLRGHFNYFGVTDNGRALYHFEDAAHKLIFKWLNRRSQRRSFTWESFLRYLSWHPLPKPGRLVSLY